MGTLVCFHAHPDDESIATGGTMARAAAAGHRVVLVFGTRGEHGEPVPGVLGDGEQLTLRRTAEVYESARALGVARVEFLGYVDSGMMGEPTNDVPWCFWQADLDRAARRLAAVLADEDVDVLTAYDDNGGYGHPDHIQVHRVGLRAAELLGVPHVFQSTINRDHLRSGMEAMTEVMDAVDPAERPDPEELEQLGKPAAEITHRVDVSAHLADKRRSMLAHRSQMADEHFMIAMPDDAFAWAFGTEWYILTPGGPDLVAGTLAGDLFEPTGVG